jgi:beta-galactosidase
MARAMPFDCSQGEYLMSLSRTESLGHGHNGTVATQRRPFRWPALLTDNGKGIAYGGDYNPDQWPEEVWADDIRLMTRAGVNTVALAIFSWDRIQPAEDRWDFGWLDRVIDMLGSAGIAVDLATATAAAPLWLYAEHPEVLPVERNGDVVNPGSRQSWSPTSPVFRRYAVELCTRLASRYGSNPFVTAWHVNNEYGWNNRYDYSSDSQRAFQRWCERRYSTIGALNDAWGTSFWSQEISRFADVTLPRHMGGDNMVNPGQQLDFERFGSDALKEFYKAERDAVESVCPDKPLTTNFMISTDQCAMDYADWSDEVDFVSNDHYFTPGESHMDELLCSDSLVDSIALGKPWYLMENSTSAVQWKPVNSRKRSGELMRDALAHVAMGADAINFFQWRQSRFGAEAFHSSMLPHAGEDSKIFRDVCALGETLKVLSSAGLQGSELVPSRSAILFDADCEWATRSATLPSTRLSHWHDARTWYRAFLDSSRRADLIPLRADWTGYDTIVLPTMLLLSSADADRVRRFVHDGGHVIVGYATGIADERFHVALGGYPGMLRSLLGIRSEEFNVLGDVDGEPSRIYLSNGFSAALWANVVTSVDDRADVLATYHGPEAVRWDLEGVPAIVRNTYGRGATYYIGCDLGRDDISRFIDQAVDRDPCGRGANIVHTVRTGRDAVFDFYFNRCSEPVSLRIGNVELLAKGRVESGLGSDDYRIGENGYLITRSTR